MSDVMASHRPQDEYKIQLNAWHHAFGTTQLTHALAERDQLRQENERLNGELDKMKPQLQLAITDAFKWGREVDAHNKALVDSKQALESALACIWDGQLSGKGVTKEYAQAVSSQISDARRTINSLLGQGVEK